jgi:hypothetical protein
LLRLREFSFTKLTARLKSEVVVSPAFRPHIVGLLVRAWSFSYKGDMEPLTEREGHPSILTPYLAWCERSHLT